VWLSTSVVIRCKNEELWIGHSIQSVLDSLEDPEIIIVDDHSTDDSLDIVRMFETFWNISILSIDKYSPGRALNLAIKRCSSASILVLSAHCVLTKYDEVFLDDLLLSNACVFGNQIPVYRGKRITKRYIWSHFTDSSCNNMWSDIENRYFLHNAFAVYNKAAIEDNQFDEHLYGKEDRYWAKKVIDDGKTVWYESQIECLHHWTANGATWKGIG
jgi:rhamnosyltransferase